MQDNAPKYADSLPAPVQRTQAHTRAVEYRGYHREDGLWDIEAHLVDTKTYVHTRRSGDSSRQPGDPVHNMWIRITIDLDMVAQVGLQVRACQLQDFR